MGEKKGELAAKLEELQQRFDRLRDEVVKLQHAKERYQHLAELTSDYTYVFRVEPNGNLVLEWLDGAFREITGYTHDELQEKGGWAALVHPGDIDIVAERNEVLRAGEQDISEFRIVTKAGKTRWLRDHGQPVWEESEGRVVRIYGSARDITDTKKASVERDQFFELSRDLFCVADFEGCFQRVNPAWTQTLGYSPEELRGRSCFEIVHPEDRASVQKELECLRGGTPTINFDLRLQDRGGDWHQVAWTATPVSEEERIFAVGRDVTEQKAMEDALRQRETQLRLMLNQMPAVLWTTDTDLRFVTGLGKGLDALGLGPNEIRGRTLYEYFGTGDPEFPAIAAHRRALQGGSARYEQEAEGRIFESYVEPLRAESGDIIGCIGTALDITERKEAERHLQKEKELSEATLEELPGIFYLFDESRRFLRWHDNLEVVSGYSASEIQTMEPLDFFTGDDREKVRAAIEEVFAEGQSKVEASLVSKDGSRTPYFFSGRRVVMEGTPCILGIGIDITERKQTERALRESEQKFRRLVESVEDYSIYMLDPEGYITSWNPGAKRITGYTTDEAIGRHFSFVYPPEERTTDRGQRVLASAAREGRYEDEGERVCKDGSTFWAHVTITPVRDAAGQLTGFSKVTRDITSWRRYEQKLIEAKEEAEEMNRIKSAFLANVSHEIRTPLTSIIGFAEVLQAEIEGHMSEFAQLIAHSGKRLKETLDSVLKFSMLEAGSIKLDTERLDVAVEVREQVELVRPQATEKGLKLTMEEPAAPIKAELDSQALARVVSNLLTNAVKFTEEGEVAVTVEETGGHILIRVCDTGVGISEEFQSHLFDEFKQESTGMNRSHEGVGLGLAITKRLIELMGGNISVQSTEGEGSVFTVSFPR